MIKILIWTVNSFSICQILISDLVINIFILLNPWQVLRILQFIKIKPLKKEAQKKNRFHHEA